MRRVGIVLLVLSALAFVASGVAFALAPALGLAPPRVVLPLATFAGGDPDLGRVVVFAPPLARPESTALRLLLVAVWAATLFFAARAARLEWRLARLASDDAATASEIMPHLPDNRPAALTPLIVALAAGAVWPWAGQDSAAGGLAAATVMAIGALWAVLRRRDGGSATPSNSLGLFAGWASVALYAAFARLVLEDMALSPELAGIVGALLLILTAVEVQLRIRRSPGFAIAIVWAMIGVAAATMETDLTLATTAIATIAAMVAVLVRVMS